MSTEVAEVYALDSRKARKQHKCCECYGSIEAGEIYSYHSGIFDGSPFSYKECSECNSLRKECDMGVHYEDSTPFEGLYETVFESLDLALIDRFIAIKVKRGGKIQPWMLERRNELRFEKQEGKL